MEPITIPLGASDELTPDENWLAIAGKGKIILKSSKVETWFDVSTLNDDALLTIVSASELAKCSSFGTGSDPFCIVYWSERSAGGEYKEVHRTRVIPKTLNPIFHNEVIKVKVPPASESDWSGVRLRIDTCDAGGDFLGSIFLTGPELQALLARNEDTCKELQTFTLVNNPLLSNKGTSAVQGSITLQGGYAAVIEELQRAEKLELLNVVVATEEDSYDESGDEGVISIKRAKDLSKADGMI